jgi:transposase
MEMLLGIPGVRVTELDIQPKGLRVELETSATSATCPICRNEAESAGVEVVDMGVHSAMGQPMHLIWRQRQWRCPVAKCRERSWAERDKGIEEFLARSPHRRTDRSEQ